MCHIQPVFAKFKQNFKGDVQNHFNFSIIKGLFLTGYTIAIVPYYVEKITMTISPLIRHLGFGTIIVVCTDKEW